MREGLRYDVWLVGLVVTVGLAALADAALRFNLAGIHDLLGQSATSSALTSTSSQQPRATPPPDPAAPHTLHSPRAAESGDASRPKMGTVRQEPIRKTALESATSPAAPLAASFGAPPVGSPGPEKKVLKTLGYVQKANGAVEAIVNQPDNTVAVLHVGDAYDDSGVSGDKFTVVKISSEAVELVAAATPPGGAPAAVQSASNLSLRPRPASPVLTAPTGPMNQKLALGLRPADGGYSKVSLIRNVVPRRASPQILAERDLVRANSSTAQLDIRQINLATTSEGRKPVRSGKVNSAIAIASGPANSATRVPEETKKESALHASAETSIKNCRNLNLNYDPDVGVGLALPSGVAAIAKVYGKPHPNVRQAAEACPERATLSERSRGKIVTPSKTLGFVERADGKTEAILDQGGEVRLVQLSDRNRDSLMAKSQFAQSAELADAPSDRMAPAPARSSDQASITLGSPAGSDRVLVPASEGVRLSWARPGLIADGATGTKVAEAGPGPPRPPPETGSPPPNLKSGWVGVERVDVKPQAVQDSIEAGRSVPLREVEPNTLAASAEYAAPAALVEMSSVRGLPTSGLPRSFSLGDEPIADQLGPGSQLFGLDPTRTTEYWIRKQRSAEELSEPLRPPPKPPPKLDISIDPENVESGTVPGRALSPPLNSGSGAPAVSEDNTEDSTSARSIGYVEWQNGRTLTVIDDGDGGVRLVDQANAHQAESAGGRSSVARAGPESIEIAELPISQASPGVLDSPHSRSDAVDSHPPELIARPADSVDLPITQQPIKAIQDKRVIRRTREKQSSPQSGACLPGKNRPAILARSAELNQSPDNQADLSAGSPRDSRIKLSGCRLFHPGAVPGACAAFADGAATDRNGGLLH